jgi:hypothetical protein
LAVTATVLHHMRLVSTYQRSIHEYISINEKFVYKPFLFLDSPSTFSVIPMLYLTNNIALQHKSRVIRFPRLIMCHFDGKPTKEFWYHLVHFGIRKLDMISTLYLTPTWKKPACLPIHVLVPAPKTSMFLSIAQYRSSLSSHRSGRNSCASSPKTLLSYWVTIAFMPICLTLATEIASERDKSTNF